MASSDSLVEQVSDAEYDRAFDAIEGELSVVLGNVERVEAACATLRHAGVALAVAPRLERLRGLIPLATARVTPAARSLTRLVRDAAAASPHPWALLERLLQSNDPGVPAAVVDDAVALAARGSLVVDGAVVAGLAEAVEREGTALTQPDTLQNIARLLQHLPPIDTDQPSPIVSLLTGARDTAVRRLAARVLDVCGAPPDADLMQRMLGPQAARLLESYLAYTSARHLDLVDLLAGHDVPPLMQSLPRVERQLGPALSREIVASLGWSRANLGLDVTPWAGISLDDSFPLLVTPAEAHLFDGWPSARRVFDRVVVVGLGGTAPDADDTIRSPASSSDGSPGLAAPMSSAASGPTTCATPRCSGTSSTSPR